MLMDQRRELACTVNLRLTMSPRANIFPHCVPKPSASLYLAYLGRRELIGRNVDGDNAGQDREGLHRYRAENSLVDWHDKLRKNQSPSARRFVRQSLRPSTYVTVGPNKPSALIPFTSWVE